MNPLFEKRDLSILEKELYCFASKYDKYRVVSEEK